MAKFATENLKAKKVAIFTDVKSDYISDYGVKQRVTIQDGKCTNTNLYVNAP
jgi:hypothetical protein